MAKKKSEKSSKKENFSNDQKKVFSERKEILWRVLIGIVSGIILAIWRYLVFVITLFNWIYVLFKNKRLKEVAEFCEIWNTQAYVYVRYLTMVSNKRPFPFNGLEKNISKFE